MERIRATASNLRISAAAFMVVATLGNLAAPYYTYNLAVATLVLSIAFQREPPQQLFIVAMSCVVFTMLLDVSVTGVYAHDITHGKGIFAAATTKYLNAYKFALSMMFIGAFAKAWVLVAGYVTFRKMFRGVD